MRVAKDPEVRRTEILDAAEHLFTTKGYAKTTVMDILGATGIAKGTFYYYFQSKEAVMDGVISRIVDSAALAAQAIAGAPGLDPVEKLRRILTDRQVTGTSQRDGILEQFHQVDNAELHHKSLVRSIQAIAPILARVVEEGVRLGAFSTPSPRETIDILLVSGQILFDEGWFRWSQEERRRRADAFAGVMEASLGTSVGCFSFVRELPCGGSSPAAAGQGPGSG